MGENMTAITATIISISIILSVILIITIYVWLSVLFGIRRHVSYKQALDLELKEIEQNHIKWDVASYNFDKIYKVIKTRYGDLDIYKFGDSSKVAIFVHGIWSNNRSSLKILDYFLSRGFSVIAYDNFGWGKSRDFGVTTMGRNESLLLEDVIEFTKSDLKPSKLIIYGESMGGGTVYSFLSIFGNHQADKFIINAGYMSFFKNIIKLGKKQIWYFIYLAYLPLMLVFWLQKWPIKPFLTKKELAKMTNVYHLHSIKDSLVRYQQIKKYLPYIKHHIYSDHNVRHVMGWYDSNVEHYKKLDSWLKKPSKIPKDKQ